MGHSHGTGHGAPSRGPLVKVLAITVSVMVLEAVVAWYAGSIALLADAGHMLTDVAAIVLAMAAMTLARVETGPQSRRSFGWARVEVLAAGANAIGLVVLCGFIVWHAVGNLRHPAEVDAGWTLAAAVVGLGANLLGVWILSRDSHDSLNLRAALLEVTADAVGSLAVVVSSIVILLTQWYRADQIASLLIAAFVLPRAVLLLRDVAEVLLESTPRNVDLNELRDHLLRTEGVVDIHDLHVWSISSGLPSMSVHVVVDETVTEIGHADAVLQRLRECLSDHFDVEHSTFQIEPAGHADTERHLHH